MKISLLFTVISVVIVGVLSFFGGMKFQESKFPGSSRPFTGRFGDGNATGSQQNRGRPGGQVTGEVISNDDKSITVRLQDGSSKIVLFSGSTSINKSAQGSTGDLKVGEQVAVFGSNNTDGTVTAQNIQLNPIFRRPTGSVNSR